MAFGHNIVAQTQPQSCALAGGFDGEKRLEYLGFYCVGNARAVIAYPKFNRLAVRVGWVCALPDMCKPITSPKSTVLGKK